MRDDICTIPVSEIFEVNDGCPMCRMNKRVEERIIKYILGDAMMEPDVRMATNEIGFCPDHYAKMVEYGNRLQLALMLQTHLEYIGNNILNGKHNPEKRGKNAKEINDGCFICNKMQWGITRMVDTIYRTYEKEEDFRNLFNNQPEFCFKHYEMLMSGINRRNMKKHGGEMAENLERITKTKLDGLYAGVSKFCSVYNRCYGDRDFGTSRDSVERIVSFLTMNEK